MTWRLWRLRETKLRSLDFTSPTLDVAFFGRFLDWLRWTKRTQIPPLHEANRKDGALYPMRFCD
jgi:hypothetical protein